MTAARQRGAALMIVLWAVILLAGLVGGMLATGGGEAALSANMIDAARAGHLAEAGVQRAVLALLDPDERRKLPLDNPAAFSLQLSDDIEISLLIKDSCGDVDLNWSPPGLLRAYGLAVGMKPAAALAFAGAITKRREPPIGAVAPWQSVRELASLPGIGPAEMAVLAAGLTVNCREAGADPRRAGVLVKRALLLAQADGVAPGISHELAYEVLATARLISGAQASVRASIWLSTEPGRPYRITAWERQQDGIRR